MKSNILYCLLISISGYLTQTCTQPYQRKEIRELTSDELNRFVQATKKLQSTKSRVGKLSIYDTYAKLHYDNERNAHGSSAFLPWHRYYLRLYEMELQKVDPKVHLPYWDWTKDYEDPASSEVLSDKLMGGNGNPNSDYNVTNGKFANLELQYPKPHRLQRKYNQGNKVSRFTAPSLLNSYLNYNRYSDFCLNFEQKHGQPHVYIGGAMKDFHEMWSPNDPLFMLHHTFVDSIWYEWQQRHPNVNQYDGAAYRRTANSRDSLVTWNVNVQSTFNTKSNFFCYTYKRYQPTLVENNEWFPVFNNQQQHQHTNKVNATRTSGSNGNNNIRATIQSLLSSIDKLDTDKAINLLNNKMPSMMPGGVITPFSNKEIIKKSEPMPEQWLKMNHLDVARVRANEQKDNQFIDLLNSFLNLSL